MTKYLPIMIDCEERRCVVVGGGAVAERKVAGLLEVGAIVVVVSPSLTDKLNLAVEQGFLTWFERCYAPGDLRGAFLVYAASDDKAVNEEVAKEAGALGIPVNVASHAEAGNFISPGIIRRGRLTVAVSTSGAGPGAGAKIKGVLEEVLGAEYEPYLDFLHHMRTEIKKRESSTDIRTRLLRKLGALDVLNEMRRGKFMEWSPEVIDTWITDNREE